MSDKKCPSCGACKECGAHPQVVPMPYPVYPYVPWTVQPYQPWRPSPTTAPRWISHPNTSSGGIAGSGTFTQTWNTGAGSYQ